MIRRLFSACLILGLALCWAALSQAQEREARRSPMPAQAKAAKSLDWTPQPGAFEQSLRRRYHNPLYAPSRRRVSSQELQRAIIRDAGEARAVLADFMNLALQQRRMARLDDPADIDAAVADFKAQIRRARGVGGEAAKLADELILIRSQLMTSWRERNADAAELQRELDEIDKSLRRSAPVENNSFVAQLLRDDTPTATADLAPALLSEDVDTIRLAMRKLDSGRASRARRDAPAVVSYVRLAGAEIEGFDARLEALTSSR
jgi:hypothetical protein